MTRKERELQSVAKLALSTVSAKAKVKFTHTVDGSVSEDNWSIEGTFTDSFGPHDRFRTSVFIVVNRFTVVKTICTSTHWNNPLGRKIQRVVTGSDVKKVAQAIYETRSEVSEPTRSIYGGQII